ncbi:TadE/TadG family type IV pilus assembly protein [Bradyrhizobium iriomotense]|uniref:Pilus biosynthesis protein TadE n=1 Tax=Bradyrhizobium iriomotense TaxID=441950 RepID=A0ABQ6APD3_9BRAD|nr:TadE/TadG family type IV pilus assembly protein [Bradyrhizobium iriomotense]GLR83795.1 pilus biosynthesis protein TadE [Bradyrhizobium iriomotense]
MTATHPAPITKRRRWRAFFADRKGATAVEFALIGAPFIALLLAIIQTFLVFFAQQLLEQVVNQASRAILTGQAQAQSMTKAQFANAVCSNVVILFDCQGLMIDVQVASAWSSANTGMPTLTYDAQGNVSNTWQYSPGNQGDIVVVRVMYLWPVYLGPLGFNLANQSNGSRLIMASTAFMNEAFVNS